MNLQTHKKIHVLLNQWDALSELYVKVQTGNNVTVQVNGTYHDEFVPGARKEAKALLQARGERIKADLKQLGFDTASLEPLREVIRPEQVNA